MTGICPQKPSEGSILPSNGLYDRTPMSLVTLALKTAFPFQTERNPLKWTPPEPEVGDLCPKCGHALTYNWEVLDKMGVIVPECFCGYQGVSNLPCDPVVYKKSCAPKGE